jgi:hypothetical protein
VGRAFPARTRSAIRSEGQYANAAMKGVHGNESANFKVWFSCPDCQEQRVAAAKSKISRATTPKCGSAASFFCFEHLLVKFPNTFAGQFQCASSCRRRGISFASPAFDQLYGRAQPPSPFHAVKEWIYRSWAEAVAVPAEFPDDPEAEDGFLGGMVQDMQPNQPDIEFLIPSICRPFLGHRACRSGA